MDVCPILVAAGADLTITNNLGKTPKELGIECGLTPEQVDQCLSMFILFSTSYFKFMLTLFVSIQMQPIIHIVYIMIKIK